MDNKFFENVRRVFLDFLGRSRKPAYDGGGSGDARLARSIAGANMLLDDLLGHEPEDGGDDSRHKGDVAKALREYAAAHPEAMEAMIPKIVGHYGSVGDRCRSSLLSALSCAGTRKTAQAYASLVLRTARDFPDTYVPDFDVRRDSSRQHGEAAAAELFPALFEAMANRPDLTPGILHQLLNLRRGGFLDASVTKGREDWLASVLEHFLRGVRRLQQPYAPDHHIWRTGEEYSEFALNAGLLLDLCGHVDCGRAMDQVTQAGDLTDPNLRLHRAISLLRRGHPLPEGELEYIAASPRARYWLHDQLAEIGIPEAMPAKYDTQAMLAEGNMADWLTFPTELGTEPNEIELLTVRRKFIETEEGKPAEPFDYYFFRFRVTEDHWARESGWEVGVAGGYHANSPPSTSSTGQTFSRFTSWESKSLEEHIAEYLGGECE